jgi:hypothetical protein
MSPAGFEPEMQINSMFQRAKHIAAELIKDQPSFAVTYSSHKDNHDLWK